MRTKSSRPLFAAPTATKKTAAKTAKPKATKATPKTKCK